MTEQKDDARKLLLMVLMALWLAAFGHSVIQLATAAPQNDTENVGLSSAAVFFGWQGVAGILAFACWGVGWSFPKQSGIRRASAVPVAMALAVAMVVAGLAVFGGSQ